MDNRKTWVLHDNFSLRGVNSTHSVSLITKWGAIILSLSGLFTSLRIRPGISYLPGIWLIPSPSHLPPSLFYDIAQLTLIKTK